MKWKMLLLVMVLPAGSCVTGGAADPCAGWEPIILTEAAIDAMSDDDAETVLAHNEFGVKRGCWVAG